MRKLVPNVPFQMLLRGANGVAYKSLPDNAIYHFCKQAKKNGMDIFRVFDALNDVEQLEVGMKAVQEAGGVVEGTLCYSGDSKFPLLENSFRLGHARSTPESIEIEIHYGMYFSPDCWVPSIHESSSQRLGGMVC